MPRDPASDSRPDTAVELRGVTKSFGPVRALDEVSLRVRKGEFFSLLGPSGCGKTTTLNLIGGFDAASSGEILIDGRRVGHVPSYARPVNTVFQSYALFPHMTVAENVGFGLRMRGVAREERRRAVREMLRLVSLEGLEERRPSQLSGGQKQRVALARALVNHPSVLLLDEPLGALDLKLRKQMQAELTRLQRKVGITFIYVTHDQEEALAMSDRIAVMDRGRVLQVGTPGEIYDRPADRFVMEFIGSPNVLTGRVQRAEADRVDVAIGALVSVQGRWSTPLEPGAAVTVLVRPERIRLSSKPPPAGGAIVTGHISKIANLGFVTHYFVRLANDQDVLVYRLNDAGSGMGEALREAQPVYLAWEVEDARVFRAESG
ncbi:MAG TPA: ABC transporter ATP-binding protein [Methylomirabilota bacterium]|jgi:spermidine/putrescine transport system ATP-binding protein|nr:ABC transporter ATP-binding protein [Methylomirabilota bacterium]